ncbi:MAG: hypothetical protein PHG08_00010 [Bacilli bacterium]|nr:hypothetical protein [Bacilli bacterium]
MSTEQIVIVPSSPVDKEEIKGYLNGASDSLTRIAGERDHINEIINEVHKKFDLPKKVVRKLIKVHYLSNINEISAETKELVDLYQQVTGFEVEE